MGKELVELKVFKQKKRRSNKSLSQVKQKVVAYKSVYQYEWNLLVDGNQGMKLTLYSLAFISKFMGHVNFPENLLMIDHECPTIEELAELMGCKRNKMSEILKELEYYDVIKKIKVGNKNYIYFNPQLISSGKKINSETYSLFRDSIFNGE